SFPVDQDNQLLLGKSLLKVLFYFDIILRGFLWHALYKLDVGRVKYYVEKYFLLYLLSLSIVFLGTVFLIPFHLDQEEDEDVMDHVHKFLVGFFVSEMLPFFTFLLPLWRYKNALVRRSE
ncbi:MAG: hypothetical protein SGCHY_005104, partial [Lobulomycetales sp.]